MSIAECVGFHWDGDRSKKKFGVSADWLMHGAAHFCLARYGSCAFLLGAPWELRIFAGRTMGMAVPQRGARRMRSSAVLGGRRWGQCVGIHSVLRMWYARNGFVWFLEVAAWQDAWYSWSFAWVVRHGQLCICIRVRSSLVRRGRFWALVLNRAPPSGIIFLVSGSTCFWWIVVGKMWVW